MKKKYSQELVEVAKHVVWFKTPEETLKDQTFFLCYLMQYGLTRDVLTVKKYFSDTDFKKALTNAYPGILDQRSWAYWNLVFFHDPNKSIPRRLL